MVISEPTYLILLLLLLVERVFELLISRRNARSALARGGIEVGRSHYRVMVAMHAAFIASCFAESVLDIHDDWPIVSTIALIFTFAAQFLRYAAVVTLGRRWSTRIIVMPEAKPITTGLYRWIRHPNYVAVIIEMAALPLIRGCWVTAMVFSIANALMLWVRIPAEEQALGATYCAAFGAVSRFVPIHRRATTGTSETDDASPH
jgi:methyltransferase